jgi:hypothetical protein
VTATNARAIDYCVADVAPGAVDAIGTAPATGHSLPAVHAAPPLRIEFHLAGVAEGVVAAVDAVGNDV